ncbi:MAG: hypothetical protein ACTSV2_07305 [Candidatus Thorarchaeota archaeon]
MLDLIALSIIFVSLIILVWSLSSSKKGSSRPKKTMGRGKPSGQKETMAFPTSEGISSDEEFETIDDTKQFTPADGPEMSSRPSASSSAPTTRHSEPMGDSSFTRDPTVAGGKPLKRSQTVPTTPTILERRASLVYWERMCLEEEFDLTVTLHQPEFKVAVPDGASVHESESVYQLPKTGHVRVIPVCSGCNISPAYRDMKVAELDVETRAEFKVLPLQQGKYDLNVEFQVVSHDGEIFPLGIESASVSIQKKPIELNLGALNISVSRRVPAFFSVVGSFFGLISFVLARLGVNVNEEIYAWSTTISTGVAGGVMILLAMMLLIKGVRPLMNEISISLK